ncbi:MAG TPA: L-rhamnose mutarotase [Dinghuibacter sp.]|uniref:L-rhamnose mutarotase n=1 Tax=Dinghuibacter sp. TaxID=2024697 RepID=UPI002C9CCBB9|nr:L-rhamnose mutarotase [Dinghuibacter sp.]HTJ10678.1 L-rhamnose mutarotase [Dinghuibacter sp.]
MQRIAFTMKLFPGFEAEYRRRHAVIWPELSGLLHEAGIRDYSIFLDPRTLTLFAYMQIADSRKLEDLPREPVMQRWWDFMKDVMETNPDQSPVTSPLQEVFYLEG